MITPVYVINIESKAKTNASALLDKTDAQNFEKDNKLRIKEKSIILMNSGWGKHWPDKEKYFGNDRDDSTDFHFPGFHPDAVDWLITERKIVGIGVDTPSVDNGPSTKFETHVRACKDNVFGLENVAKVDKIPAFGATLRVMPLKIGGGSGGPARILAEWDAQSSGADALAPLFMLSNLITIFLLVLFS